MYGSYNTQNRVVNVEVQHSNCLKLHDYYTCLFKAKRFFNEIAFGMM